MLCLILCDSCIRIAIKQNNYNNRTIKLIPATSSSHEEARVATNGEEDLWGLWGRLVSNWENEWRRRNQFVRDLVRQGVPHHFRGIVWQLLAGVDSSPEKKLYASYIKVAFSYFYYLQNNFYHSLMYATIIVCIFRPNQLVKR